uniref:Uncharacterized protein n=1 Tax=Ananas comosus var. bracteatus TaxID=296719 RepID=A0A6V7Q1V0_ANACO|nr:unnamed protein product [Ananas comosus var. bracteatus]
MPRQSHRRRGFLLSSSSGKGDPSPLQPRPPPPPTLGAAFLGLSLGHGFAPFAFFDNLKLSDLLGSEHHNPHRPLNTMLTSTTIDEAPSGNGVPRHRLAKIRRSNMIYVAIFESSRDPTCHAPGPAKALPVERPDPPYVYTYKASTTTVKIKQEMIYN